MRLSRNASSRRTARLLVCSALACTPLVANAVYKCAGPTSSPIYQDEPCPRGKELRNFDTDPPNLSVIPGRTAAATPAPRDRREGRAPREPKTAKADKPAKLRGDPAERKHVRVGMSEAELVAHLGRPDVTSGNREKRTLRWTWLPVAGDPDTITTVTLANGSVTDVDRKVVKK